MINLSRTERFIFSLCAIVFCTFAYFLYDDSLLFNQDAQTVSKNIGSFNLSQNDVRRKGEESFLWRPATTADKIYLRDSIFTGNSSRAVLKFDDGSTIEVKENSMITLNMSQGQIQLDLRYGDLVTALNEKSKIEITAGNEKFDLKPQSQEPSKVQIQKSRTRKIKVKLLEGKAEFTDKKNKEQVSLVKEKSLLIAPAASPTEKSELIKIKSSIELVTQDKAPFTLFKKGETFPLEWTATEVSHFRIEVSQNLDFTKKIYTSLTAASPHAVTAALDRGWYFWRVIGINDTGKDIIKSDIRRLFVSYYEAPQITSPQNHGDLSFDVEPPTSDFTTEVKLGWNSPTDYPEYEWQLSNNENFDSPLASDKTSKNLVQVPQLKAGIYFARVRGLLPENKFSAWSSSRQWKISINEKKPAPLELITKEVNFNPVQAQRNPAAVQRPSVLWKPLADAVSYRVELAKTKNFKDKEIFETAQPQWDWANYKAGNYYFRVWAKRSNRRASIPSDIGSLSVILSNPEISPVAQIFEKSEKIGVPAPPKNIKLNWTQIPLANKYVLEIDKDPTFKAPIKREISSNSDQVELTKPGKYLARVRAYDENSQPLTDYSAPQSIVYDYRTQLAAPTLEEPRNQVNIVLQKDIEPFLRLVWAKDPSAVSYEIELAADKEFKRIIFREKAQDAYFLIRRKIPFGSLYWRVKANAPVPEDSSEWSKPWIFNLIYKSNEITPNE